MSSPWHITLAAYAVDHGGVIAYPTEGVFGLGCHPLSAAAVDALLRLKGRAPDKGLIVIAADLAQVTRYIWFPTAEVEARCRATWPGPVTWVLPTRESQVPRWLTGGRRTLAVRVTAHPVASALCRRAGPLVSTSANPAGRPPALSALGVRRYFGDDVLVVPGRLQTPGRPTQIRDAVTGQILRGGTGGPPEG